MNTYPPTKPEAVVCIRCHALIAGSASALQRTGALIEFADCGRHVAGRWDIKPARPVQPLCADGSDI